MATLGASSKARVGSELRKGEVEMANESKKCAHPVCSCTVTSGKYCSTQCEAMEKTPDIDCTCGHPACKGGIER